MFIRYPGSVTVKQLIMGVIIGTSAAVWMVHRLPKRCLGIEEQTQLASAPAEPKIRVRRTSHWLSRTRTRTSETQLSSQKLFGKTTN